MPPQTIGWLFIRTHSVPVCDLGTATYSLVIGIRTRLILLRNIPRSLTLFPLPIQVFFGDRDFLLLSFIFYFFFWVRLTVNRISGTLWIHVILIPTVSKCVILCHNVSYCVLPCQLRRPGTVSGTTQALVGRGPAGLPSLLQRRLHSVTPPAAESEEGGRRGVQVQGGLPEGAHT